MANLRKTRQFSIRVLTALGVFFVLALAAFWNSLLSAPVKHEGWALLFLCLVAASGAALFFLAWRAADPAVIEAEKSASFEAGRTEVLNEVARRENAEHSEESTRREEADRMVATIIADCAQGTGSTADRILTALAQHMGFVQGILYRRASKGDHFNAEGTYALTGTPAGFETGDGLAGQVAESLKPMVLYDVPEHYFRVASALGEAQPRFLVFIPLVDGNTCEAVLELAAFKRPDSTDLNVINQLAAALGRLVKSPAAA
jgi:hypothetical protein